jgi:rhodanese-related sulfurtransferase
MQELIRTNRLLMVVAAFVLVIIIGLVTFKKPEVKYVLSPSESLALLSDTASDITPERAAVLLGDSSGKVVFVDVRNSVAFGKGHLKNAVNIPVRELFSKKSRTIFRDIAKTGQTVVMYGETEQQALGPWIMLRQTGYNNVKLVTGNYSQLNRANADSLINLLPQYSETPLIDTTALKSISSPVTSDTKVTQNIIKTEKKSVTPVKKSASSGGGC